MSLSFDKEKTFDCEIPVPRLASIDLLMVSFTTNFTLSKALLVCMLNFGPTLLVSAIIVAFFYLITLPNAQKRLTISYVTSKPQK